MKRTKNFSLDIIPGINHLIHLNKTDSTQNVAKTLAKAGAAENTLVIANTQTKAHGQFDRVWHADEGGLYMTLLLRPHISISFLGGVSKLTAATIAKILSDKYAIKTKVKLPNDVYAYNPSKDKWLKICGILTESISSNDISQWLLIGIGINVNNKVPLDTAVSIKEITKKNVDIEEVLCNFFEIFWQEYSFWEYSCRLKSQ